MYIMNIKFYINRVLSRLNMTGKHERTKSHSHFQIN